MLSAASSARDIVAHLETLASPAGREGLARYGINAETSLGIRHSTLRDLAKVLKKDHERALALWESGTREARVIAAFTADPKKLTKDDARRWAAEFNSWDIVDSVSDLFVATPFWRELVEEFAEDEREFVRRTTFAMLAWSNVGRHKVQDDVLAGYLPLIERHATDPRNFVKKAVNWALRQMGKRSLPLNRQALNVAQRLAASPDRTARWVGRDAVKELSSDAVQARLARRAGAG